MQQRTREVQKTTDDRRLYTLEVFLVGGPITEEFARRNRQKPELLGPVIVPSAATQLLREYWDISCALGRVRGKWRMVEVANVYPG